MGGDFFVVARVGGCDAELNCLLGRLFGSPRDGGLGGGVAVPGEEDAGWFGGFWLLDSEEGNACDADCGDGGREEFHRVYCGLKVC